MKVLISMGVLLLVLSGCVSTGTGQGASGRVKTGQVFYNSLAAEYLALAAFDASTSGGMADVFEAKARKSHARQYVAPDDVGARRVPAFAVEELRVARARLMAALATEDKSGNEALLALAQVKFDCWLLYQQFVTVPGTYIGCHDAFNQAMSHVGMTRAVARADGTTYEISFEDGSVMLGENAAGVVDNIAAQSELHPDWHVTIIGHTKAKVGPEDTSNIAVRRTIALKNALIQKGVDQDNVTIRMERQGRSENVEIDFHPLGADQTS